MKKMQTIILYILYSVILLFCLWIGYNIYYLSKAFGTYEKGEITVICLGGDVMLGRTVNEIMKEKGTSYPWGNLIPIFKNADCTLVNLETTLTTHTQKEPKVFNFKSLPAHHVTSLQDAHITAVNIANNHIKDFGNEGLAETIVTLDHANIAHTGAGQNILEAKKPVIIKINNMTIGILGYTDNEPSWQATKTNPGINYIPIDANNMKTVINDITNIRSHVDILIVSLHWGPNMLEFPLQAHIAFAHALIDHGVDIVHGHSAHVLQGIEIYKNKLILYDTGNLVDDYAVDASLRNDLSAIFKISCSKKDITSKKVESVSMAVEIIPVNIENMQTNICTGELKQMVFDLLNKRSAPFNTFIPYTGVLYSEKY